MTRLLLFLALTGCATATPDVTPEAEPGARALALETALRRVIADQGPLWPGFNVLEIPLAVYDGRDSWLFRHPLPPPGFGQAGDQVTSGVTRYAGRHPAITANSSAEIGGVMTATVVLPDGAEPDAPLAIHEAFHVFQRARHPSWTANEADLFTYPSDQDGLLMLRRLESAALRRGVQSRDDERAACWARTALELRQERFAMLDSASISYERGTELNEGLATYVEHRARGGTSSPMPAGEFGASEVRQRAYASGASLAFLLDRLAPGWQPAFDADDTQPLDGLLRAAVGDGEACAFTVEERATARTTAATDQRALVAARAARLATFRARDGWRVVVESPASLLWPQGFDPLNVERVLPTAVVHARFLKLGNERGGLEMLDAAGVDLEALTEGAGPHPLWNGVRRVEIAGIASEPVVRTVGDSVQVTAAGITLGLGTATVVRDGRVVRVRVGR
jgi:hypothetical protein